MRYFVRFTLVCVLMLLAALPPVEPISVALCSRLIPNAPPLCAHLVKPCAAATAMREQTVVVPGGAVHSRSDNGVVDYLADPKLTVRARSVLSKDEREAVIA